MQSAIAVLLVLILTSCATVTSHDYSGPLSDARQLIAVTSDSWDATVGSLSRYERAAAGGSWRAVGPAVPVVLGRTGMAWGRGLHAVDVLKPVKREGDGKSPAGVFKIGSAFGFDELVPTKLRYLQLRPDTECVDDPAARQYNSIVSGAANPAGAWRSSERMREVPEYRYGLVIEHNASGVKDAGSCIFMHVRRNADTAGCTALDEDSMRNVLAWLDRSLSPRLVQLPRDEYEARRVTWRLPALAAADRR